MKSSWPKVSTGDDFLAVCELREIYGMSSNTMSARIARWNRRHPERRIAKKDGKWHVKQVREMMLFAHRTGAGRCG